MLHSGCLKSCPPTVAQWTIDACNSAKCKPSQCTFKTSAAPSRHGAGKSTLLLAVLATAAATLLGTGGGAGLW